ncbi:MAG TPA: lysylphosphatidylglycerol synthase transmembrane domain-containing protein [Chloroflexota bacterium]|nr:lysylphosphatidylglycerol synthase transmembrane domain-containing protein [Chloroflexota bacterium]
MAGKSRYLGIIITLVFVGLLVWKIDLHEVGTALAQANYVWVIPAVCCTLTSYALRTLRWRIILRPIRPLGFRTLLPVLMIGFMANNLLPARMGELVRAYALGRKTGLSKSLGLATILLERLCDGISLIVVLGIIALFYPLPLAVREAGTIAGGIFLAGGIGTLVLLTRQRLAIRVIGLVVRPLPKRLGEQVTAKTLAFVEGLRVLQHGKALLVIVAWSAIIWSVEATSYLLILRGVHPALSSGTPLLAALMMMAVVNLGSLIPSAPGYIGAYQFFGVMALGAFGIPAGIALAVAIITQAEQWITVTGVGLGFVARESMGLGSLTSPALSMDNAAEEPAGL